MICGRDAAAKRDVIETAGVRYPPARFRVEEAAVQGPGAVPQILAALERLDRDDEVDVIVLARGGGSFEDLLPFSDERLVRAVAPPDAGGVGDRARAGHADRRPRGRRAGGTPSLAARLVVPDYAAITADLTIWPAARRTGAADAHPPLPRVARDAGVAAGLRRPAQLIAVRRESLLRVRDGLDRWPGGRLEGAGAGRPCLRPPAAAGAGCHARPRYAIVQDAAGTVVTAADAVTAGQRIGVRLSQGPIAATVEEVTE